MRIFFNGVEPAHTDPTQAYDYTTMLVGTNYIGPRFDGTLTASGFIDEFHV